MPSRRPPRPGGPSGSRPPGPPKRFRKPGPSGPGSNSGPGRPSSGPPRDRDRRPFQKPAPPRGAAARPSPNVSPGDSAPERIQKLLAHAGLGSRRACEEFILQGRVTVNGQVVRELGVKIVPGRDRLAVDGEPIHEERPAYIAVNKPKGYVSTNSDPSGRPRVVDIIPDIPQRVYTVGRLDEMSVGLMLLTNDGDLANRLAHPKFGVEKVYRAVVAGSPTPEVLTKLTEGVWLAEGKVRAKRVRPVGKQGDATILELVLAEGKNREVRRMLAKFGHKVMSLVRVAVGPITIKGLKPGGWRFLTSREVDLLRKVADGQPVPSGWFDEDRSRGPRPISRGPRSVARQPTGRPTGPRPSGPPIGNANRRPPRFVPGSGRPPRPEDHEAASEGRPRPFSGRPPRPAHGPGGHPGGDQRPRNFAGGDQRPRNFAGGDQRPRNFAGGPPQGEDRRPRPFVPGGRPPRPEGGPGDRPRPFAGGPRAAQGQGQGHGPGRPPGPQGGRPPRDRGPFVPEGGMGPHPSGGPGDRRSGPPRPGRPSPFRPGTSGQGQRPGPGMGPGRGPGQGQGQGPSQGQGQGAGPRPPRPMPPRDAPPTRRIIGLVVPPDDGPPSRRPPALRKRTGPPRPRPLPPRRRRPESDGEASE